VYCYCVGSSHCQSSTVTGTTTQLMKTDSSGAITARLGKRKRPSRKPDSDADSQLMNRWLQSEIDKNTAKQSLMAAQKELIELKKAKLQLEIKQMQLPQILAFNEI